jgi:hypothetical protein
MYPTPQLRRSQRLQQTPLRNEIRLNDVVGNSSPNSPSLNKRRAIPARPLTVGAGKPTTVYGDRNVFLAEGATVEGEEDATPLASARGRPRLDETPSLQRLLLMDTPQHLKTLLRRFTPRSTYGHATEHELTVPSSPLLSVSRENMEEAVVQSASVHNGEPSSLLMAVLCFCLAIIAMPLYFAWSNVHLLLSLGHFLCIRPLSYLLSFSRPVSTITLANSHVDGSRVNISSLRSQHCQPSAVHMRRPLLGFLVEADGPPHRSPKLRLRDPHQVKGGGGC